MQRQIDKLDKDTYRVRKAEGRPKHGQTSFTLLGVGALSWFLVMVALALPEWRANWIGVLGYPYKRSWGLFSVSGMETKMHHVAMSDSCRYFSQLAVAGVCASPVCLWYRTKCQAYMDLAWVSYCTGFCLLMCLILHTLCLIWTSRMTPRMIRWAATWWIGLVIIHISVLVFWVFMTGDVFTTMDSVSLYPEPDFSFAMFIYCLAIMCICVCGILGISLMKMWPESSSSEGSSTSSDDDDDSASDNPMPHQQGYGQPPPGYQQPPPGYQGGPPMGGPPMMGGPPPMGFQGGPPMDYQGGPPQQGWEQQQQQGWEQQGGPPQQGWDQQQQPPQQGWEQQPQQQGWDQQPQQQGWEQQQQQQQQPQQQPPPAQQAPGEAGAFVQDMF